MLLYCLKPIVLSLIPPPHLGWVFVLASASTAGFSAWPCCCTCSGWTVYEPTHTRLYTWATTLVMWLTMNLLAQSGLHNIFCPYSAVLALLATFKANHSHSSLSHRISSSKPLPGPFRISATHLQLQMPQRTGFTMRAKHHLREVSACITVSSLILS